MKLVVKKSKKVVLKIGDYQTWTVDVGLEKEFDETEAKDVNQKEALDEMNDLLNAEIRKEVELVKKIRENGL